MCSVVLAVARPDPQLRVGSSRAGCRAGWEQAVKGEGAWGHRHGKGQTARTGKWQGTKWGGR